VLQVFYQHASSRLLLVAVLLVSPAAATWWETFPGTETGYGP
jgi:hypothetical protein